jgi:hypothetical protein
MNAALKVLALFVYLLTGNVKTPRQPSLAGNWRGYATESNEVDGQKMLLIMRQTGDSLYGFSRCYLDPGAYVDSRFYGGFGSLKNEIQLTEDSLIAQKNTGTFGRLIFERYLLKWNETADTLRGYCYNVRNNRITGRGRRKVLLWKVTKEAP